MAHGPVGRKPGRDVAAHDGVNRAIDRREQEKRVGHNLAQRREDAGRVQRQVSAERKDNDDHETGEQGPDAATDTPRRLLFIHDLRPSSGCGRQSRQYTTRKTFRRNQGARPRLSVLWRDTAGY